MSLGLKLYKKSWSLSPGRHDDTTYFLVQNIFAIEVVRTNPKLNTLTIEGSNR